MRAAFGLVSLLVVVGVIVMLMKTYHPADTVRRGQDAREQAEQFAGVGAAESIGFEPVHTQGGKLAGLKVARLEPGGVMEKAFGLKVGDLIVGVGPLEFRDMDADEARAFALEAYQRRQVLTVRRGDEPLKLEWASPSQPRPEKQGGSAGSAGGNTALQRQLDAIPGIRRP